MIKETCIQGSPEWDLLRVGRPTASCFDKLITTKGEPSKSRVKLIYTLAGERLINKKEESYKNAAMERGQQMEDEARSWYALTRGVEVEQVGICFPDKKRLYGASPDGLIGEDGLLEVKCPILSTMVGYMLDGNIATEYKQQLQGQLLVTGRKWVDIIGYYPCLTPIVVRVERDESFLKALKVELELAVREIQIITEKLRGL
jgi:hypothetical protein